MVRSLYELVHLASHATSYEEGLPILERTKQEILPSFMRIPVVQALCYATKDERYGFELIDLLEQFGESWHPTDALQAKKIELDHWKVIWGVTSPSEQYMKRATLFDINRPRYRTDEELEEIWRQCLEACGGDAKAFFDMNGHVKGYV